MAPFPTTTGLRADGTDPATIPDVAWAVGAGTVNAITAAYDEPNTELTDGLMLGVRATGANTSATPTFNPDGLGTHTIVRGGGTALLPGDIPAALAELLLRYNLANTRWELLNPARSIEGVLWAVAGGSADVITATYSPAVLAVSDGLELKFRAAAANTTATPTFSPNGLTARTIVKRGGLALLAADLTLSAEYTVRYRSAAAQWEIVGSPFMVRPIIKVLTANDTGGTNVNTAQPWFPTAGSATVAGSTTYKFKGALYTSRAAGANSHTTAVLFGGTATLTSIAYLAKCKEGDANDLQDMSGFLAVAATALVVKAASTSTTEQTIIEVEGIVRINATGTFIPQFIYSAAPGGAPTILANSYFHMEPIGDNTFATQGSWA